MRQIRHFELYIPIFAQTLFIDSYWLHCYGQYDSLDPTDIYLNPLWRSTTPDFLTIILSKKTAGSTYSHKINAPLLPSLLDHSNFKG